MALFGKRIVKGEMILEIADAVIIIIITQLITRHNVNSSTKEIIKTKEES